MKLTSHVLAGGLLATAFLPAQGTDDTGPRREYTPSAPSTVSLQPEARTGLPTAAGQRLPSLRTPIHSAPADLGLTYGIWAAGDSYKASFHAGMTFVPYLGASYPTTQSLHWQTTSARLGSTELLSHANPEPVPADWRYEYHFGPLTEAYDVRGEGLEQTFVLQQLPAAGDLVITGVVDTLLRARNVAPAHQSLLFRDDQDQAIVEYGHAFAIDAQGDRVSVLTGYADGAITLTVPGAWLARAALPITVDPLLTRVSIITWGAATDGAVESVDIGRDDEAVTDNVLITYTRSASATDSDLWARLCDDDFSGQSLVFSDITTSWSSDETSCAYVGGSSRWAIVFRRYFPNLTPRLSQLRCHVHASADTVLATNYGSLTPPSGSNDWRADVGGVDSFATGSNAMVVFQREDNGVGNNFANSNLSVVAGSLLDTTSLNGTFGAPFTIKPSATHDNERPSVNQVAEGGASFSWICIYQRFLDGVADEDWDLNGARITQSGVVAAGTWISDLAVVTPSQHQLGPIVEGSSGRYAVTFTTVDVPSFNFKTTLISGKQVQVERFDWSNSDASPSGNQAPVELRSNNDRRWEATGIGYDTNDDSHWTVGFRAIAPGVPSLYYTRLGYHGQATEGPVSTLLYSVAAQQPIGGACVFDNDSNSFLFAYGVDDGGPGHPVYGHALTYDTPTVPSTFGVSCSSATLSWTGNQQIGAEFNTLHLNGAPASAIHIMLAATVTTNVPVIHPIVFPGCQLFVMAAGPGYLGSFPTAVGANVNWQLPLPEFLAGQTLHFQDWYIDNTGLLFSTQRLSVPIVK